MRYSNLNETRVATAAHIAASLIEKSTWDLGDLSEEKPQQAIASRAVQIADYIIRYVEAYDLGMCK